MVDLMLVLAGLGWGLLVFGALTHAWHFTRLRELLALHFDRTLAPASALLAAEVALAVAFPVALWLEPFAIPVAAGGALVGLVFVGWIGWLLRAGSDLPCACSFGSGPTSRWSLARAGLVLFVPLLLASPDQPWADQVATLAVCLAAAGALFVLPESLQWPEPIRAQLARLDAHSPGDVAEPAR